MKKTKTKKRRKTGRKKKRPKGTRIFGGQRYGLVRPDRYKTVRTAKNEAKKMRKRGYLVRRVKRTLYLRNK